MPNLMHKLLTFVFTSKHFRPLYIVRMNGFRLLKFDGSSFGSTYIAIKFGSCFGRAGENGGNVDTFFEQQNSQPAAK